MFNVKSFMFSVLLFVVIAAADLFASSPKREEFGIANYSSQILVVHKEFWNEPEDNWWKQSINGFELIFIDEYFYRTNITLRPRLPEGTYSNSYTVISCFPPEWNIYYPDRDPYMEMAAVSIMDKLRSIYKTFTIGTIDNPTMFTLENMEEKLVQRQTPEKSPVYRYTLEIRDEDLTIAAEAGKWQEELMFQYELKIDDKTLRAGQETLVSMIVKDVSNIEKRLDVRYFNFSTARLLWGYFSARDQELVYLPLCTDIIMESYGPDEPLVSLKPGESMVFETRMTYKYVETYDAQTNKDYNGLALVFRTDGIFFPVPDGVREIMAQAGFRDVAGNYIASNEVVLKLK